MRARKKIYSDNPKVKIGDNMVNWICSECGKHNESKSLTCLCGFNYYLLRSLNEQSQEMRGLHVFYESQ